MGLKREWPEKSDCVIDIPLTIPPNKMKFKGNYKKRHVKWLMEGAEESYSCSVKDISFSNNMLSVSFTYEEEGEDTTLGFKFNEECEQLVAYDGENEYRCSFLRHPSKKDIRLSGTFGGKWSGTFELTYEF